MPSRAAVDVLERHANQLAHASEVPAHKFGGLKPLQESDLGQDVEPKPASQAQTSTTHDAKSVFMTPMFLLSRNIDQALSMRSCGERIMATRCGMRAAIISTG